MSDVYIPGVRSRFNSEKIIEDLMKIERIPRDRTQQNIENLQDRKSWWQELGRRVTSLRESSRLLFSFQNPFNERIAVSSNENVITAVATREAIEQEYRFTVKQLAQADRFLSNPLDEKARIESGSYAFSVGKDEIAFNFRGGTLREFTDAVNRHGRNKIGASLLTVQPGTRSLLLESKLTGEDNRLGFSGDAALLAVRLGMVETVNDSRQEITITENTVREGSPVRAVGVASAPVSINDGALELPPLATASIPFGLHVEHGSPLILKIETATKVNTEVVSIPQPPPGPGAPLSGSVTYSGMTIENNPSTAPLPEWTPPPAPQRLSNLSVLSLRFSDGSTAALPPITDTGNFAAREYNLSEIAGGKTITALHIDNANTHRNITIRGAEVFDPDVVSGAYKPLKAVSTAQNAIVSMEGIDMIRPSNSINDIIPGVTITLRNASDRPERLDIRPDREGVKEAIISLVGNYNRLMAELNILSRNDERLIDEITYLDKEEIEEMRKRLGAFSGDTTLTQLRSNMIRAVSSPYPTDAEQELALLAQIGISTNVRGGGGGYSVSQMRGYLEINEKTLDTALEDKLPAIKQLFGSDTTGDMLIDTGVAFNLDTISQPFVGTGGIIALKTGTIDSRISQDQRRIDSMDRQLAQKEADLKIQYARMESAYSRMEQMSNSLDNFSRQNNNNR
ncbi:MAG: flagellar filament capping protein FliD [Treponema sp.]|nr:flagellar filament capping protein FliD [Treponema sp.]